jgi:hypothetical protein
VTELFETLRSLAYHLFDKYLSFYHLAALSFTISAALYLYFNSR